MIDYALMMTTMTVLMATTFPLSINMYRRDEEVAMYGSCNLKQDTFDDKYPCSKSDSANNNEQIIIHEPQAGSGESKQTIES